MWKYKTGELVRTNDTVKISKRWAKEHNVTQYATVIGLQGFVTVQLSNGNKIDLDMRSLTLVN